MPTITELKGKAIINLADKANKGALKSFLKSCLHLPEIEAKAITYSSGIRPAGFERSTCKIFSKLSKTFTQHEKNTVKSTLDNLEQSDLRKLLLSLYRQYQIGIVNPNSKAHSLFNSAILEGGGEIIQDALQVARKAKNEIEIHEEKLKNLQNKICTTEFVSLCEELIKKTELYNKTINPIWHKRAFLKDAVSCIESGKDKKLLKILISILLVVGGYAAKLYVNG